MPNKKKLKKQIKLLTRVCDWYSDKLDELYAEIERLSPKDVPEPHAPDDLPTCILKGESVMDSCGPSATLPTPWSTWYTTSGLSTEEVSDDGWVEWFGNSKAAPTGLVEVVFRDGECRAYASELDWGHLGWDSDIIRYRRIQEAPDSRSERHARAVSEEGEE